MATDNLTEKPQQNFFAQFRQNIIDYVSEQEVVTNASWYLQALQQINTIPNVKSWLVMHRDKQNNLLKMFTKQVEILYLKSHDLDTKTQISAYFDLLIELNKLGSLREFSAVQGTPKWYTEHKLAAHFLGHGTFWSGQKVLMAIQNKNPECVALLSQHMQEVRSAINSMPEELKKIEDLSYEASIISFCAVIFLSYLMAFSNQTTSLNYTDKGKGRYFRIVDEFNSDIKIKVDVDEKLILQAKYLVDYIISLSNANFTSVLNWLNANTSSTEVNNNNYSRYVSENLKKLFLNCAKLERLLVFFFVLNAKHNNNWQAQPVAQYESLVKIWEFALASLRHTSVELKDYEYTRHEFFEKVIDLVISIFQERIERQNKSDNFKILRNIIYSLKNLLMICNQSTKTSSGMMTKGYTDIISSKLKVVEEMILRCNTLNKKYPKMRRFKRGCKINSNFAIFTLYLLINA